MSEFAFVLIVLGIVFLILWSLYKKRESRKEKRDRREYFKVPGDGHKVWELDLGTLLMGEIKPTLSMDGQSREVVKKENHLYCTALNQKNAIRQFNKMLARVKAGKLSVAK